MISDHADGSLPIPSHLSHDLRSFAFGLAEAPSLPDVPPNLPPRLRGTLADPAVLALRAAARGASHVAALDRFVAGLRARHGDVPDVDPCDGGVGARLLLLLETPGPGAQPLRFVSRDNPTGTAANIRRFTEEAGIGRGDSVIWNAVPWVIHPPGARNRAPRRGEVAAGLAELPGFLALLPRLTVVVLAGRVAAGARPLIRAARPSKVAWASPRNLAQSHEEAKQDCVGIPTQSCLGLAVIEMPHPSPTIVCTSPTIPARIRAALAEAAALLAAGP